MTGDLISEGSDDESIELLPKVRPIEELCGSSQNISIEETDTSLISPTAGSEKLDPRYRKRRSWCFTHARVLKTAWTEPSGEPTAKVNIGPALSSEDLKRFPQTKE
jgi:hypothetical protein